MPSSAVRTFTDPDEYAAVIRQGTVEPTTTGHGQFTAKLTRIDLHRLWMQRFEQNLSQILHVDGWGGRVSFTFRTHPGPHLFAGGFEYQPTNIVRPGPGQGYFIRSSGAFRLGAMSLPMEDLSSIGVLAGVDVTRSRDAMLLTPPPTAMARLQRLHATAAGLADDAPEIIAHPEAARSLEQALIQAMADCLATREEEYFGARAARDCHAPLSQGCGGEPGGTALHPGNLQGDQGFTAGVAPVLPGAFGNGAKTLPPAAPHAPGTAGPAPGNAWYDIGYGDCDAPRFLAARSLCRQIPFPVRRVSVRHTARAIRLAAASVCGK